jgi:hypothetical protein
MFRKLNVLAAVLAVAALGSSMTAVNAMPSQHIGVSKVRLLAPRVPVQVQVPVSTTAIGAAVAQGTGCEAIPRLAAIIDELLPMAQLSAIDLTKITVLRELIQDLSVNGKEGSARDVEEVAMSLLGYEKLWLRCGLGTFNWIKQAG